jgi:hypothetical protein
MRQQAMVPDVNAERTPLQLKNQGRQARTATRWTKMIGKAYRRMRHESRDAQAGLPAVSVTSGRLSLTIGYPSWARALV